jgi:hypothetical protein
LGRWAASQLFTTSEWANGNAAGFARDVGIAKISSQGGRTLAQAVGTQLSPIYNTGRNLNAMSLGYPSNIGGGSKMVQATGVMSLGSTAFSPNNVKLPSTMTFGASGGPWVVNGNQVNGLNSYITSTSPTEMYSPYFDTKIQTLINTANQ